MIKSEGDFVSTSQTCSWYQKCGYSCRLYSRLRSVIPYVGLKNAQFKSCKLSLIWGQNEDCSPECSTSESSEKLLQRCKEKSQYIRDFGEGGIHASAHIFLKFSASHKKQSSV